MIPGVHGPPELKIPGPEEKKRSFVEHMTN